MKNVPEELILEILLRLPLKSLLRFKCVSKSWLSLISNPHFAKSHFERSSPHANRIIHTIAFEARSVDFNASLHDDSATARLNLPLCKQPADVQIMGSSRGFLLLVTNDFNLLIWNPATGACKKIPQSPLWIDVFLCGFGYDASTDDYLIVLASYNYIVSDCVANLEIFSLKTDSWKKLENGNYRYINLMDDPYPMGGSILNGAIHWLALRVETLEDTHGVIIAFDLTERNLREVPMPDDFNDEFCDLKVLGGCLSLIDYNYPDEIEIWVMREYGVKSSWTMRISVSLVKIPTDCFSPICFTEDGEVVGTDDITVLIKCNDKGDVLEHRQYCDVNQGFVASASVYSESLLCLPSYDGENVEDRQRCFKRFKRS